MRTGAKLKTTGRIGLVVTVCALAIGCTHGHLSLVGDQTVISQADQAQQSLAPAVITDPMLANYIQSVGQRIIQSAAELNRRGYSTGYHADENTDWMYSNQMQFHFVNSKTLNAFTTGGTHMYVYSELFRQCRDEDELAAVMAHEYAHVYSRHVQKGMDRQYVTTGVAAGAGALGYAAGGKEHGEQYGNLAAGVAALGGQFLGMGFTRQDEAEADQAGFNFYAHAGWDPNQFGAFFQHMIDMGLDSTPALLSDHPTLASRVEKAHQWAAALPAASASWRKPPIASPEQFRQLQQRAATVGQSMPDDKALANAQQLLQAMPRSCWTPVQMNDQVQARQRILQQLKQQQTQQNPQGNRTSATP